MSFDQKWFERIKLVNAKVPSRLKMLSHFSTKRRFLGDTTKEPVFELQHISSSFIKKNRVLLEELELDILNCPETLSVVKNLYIKKISEKRDQLRLLEVLHDVHSSDRRQELLIEAQELSERIYVAPEFDIYAHIINKIRAKLSNEWYSLQNLAAYRRMQYLFPHEMETGVIDIQVSVSNESSNDIVYIDAVQLAKFFEKTLKQIGLDKWRVKVSSKNIGVIKVRPRNRYISIPNSGVLSNRLNPVTENGLNGLLAHEVLVHARRVENGYSSGLFLLSIGLDKYLKGEEGVATYYEQKFAGNNDYSGFLPYFTTGLAYGFDRGGVRRVFSEVFAILRDYHTLDSYGKNLDSNNLAFLSCVRVFKADPSFVLTRDCVYRAGNIAVHQLLQQKIFSDQYLNAGKFDPTNEEHVQSLLELGILSN